MTDSTQAQYNKFSGLSSLSYSCIEYLIDNEEMLWKLLKYNDADSWNRDNLTSAEKSALVYDGSPNETDYRVFMDIGADNSWTEEACILRVSPVTVIPTNHINGTISMAFEVYCHYRSNHLSNYKTKIDYATQRIIEIMNGAEIDDVGRLFFDSRISACRSTVIGSIPFKGRGTIFCNNALGS